MKTNDSVKHAAAAVGGVTKLATLLGVQPPTVSQWINGTRSVPPRQCYAIERACNGVVTRRELRPSDWWQIWPELISENFPIPAEAA